MGYKSFKENIHYSPFDEHNVEGFLRFREKESDDRFLNFTDNEIASILSAIREVQQEVTFVTRHEYTLRFIIANVHHGISIKVCLVRLSDDVVVPGFYESLNIGIDWFHELAKYTAHLQNAFKEKMFKIAIAELWKMSPKNTGKPKERGLWDSNRQMLVGADYYRQQEKYYEAARAEERPNSGHQTVLPGDAEDEVQFGAFEYFNRVGKEVQINLD